MRVMSVIMKPGESARVHAKWPLMYDEAALKRNQVIATNSPSGFYSSVAEFRYSATSNSTLLPPCEAMRRSAPLHHHIYTSLSTTHNTKCRMALLYIMSFKSTQFLDSKYCISALNVSVLTPLTSIE